MDLKAHDALASWLGQRFGVEGMAMVAKDGPGLDRIRSIFSPFIQKLSKSKVITIAGTNGKGETAYRLEKLLLANGLKVATWTSPHLVSVTERMRFNGSDVEATVLRNVFEQLEETGKNLSYYEFLFLSFLEVAASDDFEVLILEVGLGGRLDAVNLLDADLAAVCSIGRDHQAILGHSLEGILYEKLGVTRSGKWCLTALDSRFLRAKAKKWCDAQGVKWIDGFEKGFLSENDTYPRRNQVLAHMLYATFKGNDLKNALCSLKNTSESFPGRREVMTLGALSFIFIGAHNVDGFRQAIRLWCSEGHPDEIWTSFSARPEKDINACVAMLAKLPCKVRLVLSAFEHPRALDSQSLKRLAKTTEGRIEFEANWKDVLNLGEGSPRKIAIAGSYYFVGAVMRELIKRGSSRA